MKILINIPETIDNGFELSMSREEAFDEISNQILKFMYDEQGIEGATAMLLPE